jgi:hypothetical protein
LFLHSAIVHLGRIANPQIEWCLISVSATTDMCVAWSPPVSEPLHTTFRLKFALNFCMARSFWWDKLNINLLAFRC